ncbi:hypothetical protein CPB83DRAFT_432480 [Crepidotus variabilis]|uniref:Uncharacterized protein n=1 Tax=Crepidotus variabilis TaxID=179855 RepID=A0A9P6EDV3_9AGAR|nr:hypothetical protein CPB83DRAFT_432480 [Crepidotus variabilis]
MSQKTSPEIGSILLFNENFEQQLQRVQKDVGREWPKFRDSNQAFKIVKKELEDLNLEDLGEFLSVYSILLDCVHQYPHKKDIAHRHSLKQALQTDAYDIIRCIWQDALQNLEPFSRRKAGDGMFLDISTFYLALFRLADDSYGDEEFAQLWLQ